MYLFANSLDWERNFNFVQSMCHSLDFEECSKPKIKSVGLHFTVPQIDKEWDGSAHSHNIVGGARVRVRNLKCRFIFKQSGNWKIYTHHIDFDAFSYNAVKISWWFDAHLRFPAKMSRWPWRPTRYVQTALLYLRIGLADWVQFWGVSWGSWTRCLTQVMGGLSLHVRTCRPHFCISGSAWPIVFKFGMWVGGH